MTYRRLIATPHEEDPMWNLVADWCNNEETTQYMATGRTWVSPKDAHRLWGGEHSFLIAVGDEPWDEQVVGVVGLYGHDSLSEKAELRIMLGAHRGGGIGKWATQAILRYGFTVMKLWRIYLGTAQENFAARRAFERNGFGYEGALADDLLRGGVRITNVRYGLLRRDWETLNA